MTEHEPLDVTIISGLSGAGRSAAGDVLEDLGFFVIDNLPPALIPKVTELGRGRGGGRFALVVDTRAGEFPSELEAALGELREAAATEANLMANLLDCARVHATEGEIVASLQQVFGTYTETPVF